MINTKMSFILKIGTIIASILLIVIACVIAKDEINEEDSYEWVSKLADEVPNIENDGITYKYNSRIRNILILGIDNNTVEEHIISQTGGQSDLILLFSIDYLEKKINLVQINRDTITLVNKIGIMSSDFGEEEMQIALAYAYGNNGESSCQNAVKAVGKLLHNIAIDDYIALGMDAIPIITEEIEGVQIELNESLTEIDPTYVEGALINLQGDAALEYLRARSTVGDGTNIKRMERQKVFLKSCLDKISSIESIQVSDIESVYNKLQGYMISSMSKVEFSKFVNSIVTLEASEIYTPQGNANYENEFVEFYVDKKSLLENILKIFFIAK